MKGNGYAKKFTKRMNRGIALGLVLGIGLTCFVVADSLKFRRDTAAIGACIVSYITDLARLNERLEATDVGRVITQQDRDAMAAGLDEIFEKYHADPRLAESITVYEGFCSNEIADALEEWLRRTAGFELVSLDVDTGVDSPFTISYERQGHRFALARINDLPLTITLVGHLRSSIEIFLGGGPSYLIDEVYSSKEENVPTAEWQSTIYVSGTVYLTLEDGQWKILMSDFYTKKKPVLE